MIEKVEKKSEVMFWHKIGLRSELLSTPVH